MCNSNIDALESKILDLKAELVKVYCDSTIPYHEIIRISQELDILIVEYHKLRQPFGK